MKKTAEQVFLALLTLVRLVVGLLVVHAGYKLLQRRDIFVAWSLESSFAGLFVILLGVAFIALALFPKIFKD